MDRSERRGDRDPHVQRLQHPEAPALGDAAIERHAGHVLHREADDAARLVDGQRIEAHDVGVLDAAERARLVDDPQPLRLHEREELDRDSAELGRAIDLLGEPHRSEAAAPER